MNLLDALKDPPVAGRKIDAILSKATEEEREALLKALSSPEWPSDALARTLTATVSPVSESSVRRYRKDVLRIVQ